AVLYHHERCNGSGYPKGLKCDEIPLMAKIIAVADVIEAMTAERPYKRAFSLKEVFDYLRKEKGTLFDPEVVEAAERAYSEIAEIVKRDI
ncbi:MAG: HD domain-containing phosphohydrolase, partial [Desulfurobacteriaceae bacterium]